MLEGSINTEDSNWSITSPTKNNMTLMDHDLLSCSNLDLSQSCLSLSLSFLEFSFWFSTSRLLILSLARFKITTLDALSLLDSSGTWSRRRRKQFFSSFRRCLSITLCVRRLSSSSSTSAECLAASPRGLPERDSRWWDRSEVRERLLEEEWCSVRTGEEGRGAA